MFKRCWLALALVGWVQLAACTSDGPAPEETGRGSVKQPDGDSESDGDGDGDEDSPQDEEACVRSGEFGDCLDSGKAPPTINDAGCGQGAGSEFGEECPEPTEPDAGEPDAAAPTDGL